MKKIIKNLAYLCVLTMTLLCSGCGEEQVTISGNSEENVTEKASQQGAEEDGADSSDYRTRKSLHRKYLLQ